MLVILQLISLAFLPCDPRSLCASIAATCMSRHPDRPYVWRTAYRWTGRRTDIGLFVSTDRPTDSVPFPLSCVRAGAFQDLIQGADWDRGSSWHVNGGRKVSRRLDEKRKGRYGFFFAWRNFTLMLGIIYDAHGSRSLFVNRLCPCIISPVRASSGKKEWPGVDKKR